jgi:NitT/TauT family transport system substrate-binding protein
MKMARKYLVVSLPLALIISVIPSLALADSTASLACVQPSTTPVDLGTIVVAAQNAEITSTEWGVRQGCFKKYGLNVKTSSITNSTIGLAGVISGSFDLTATTPTNLVQAIVNGSFQGKIIAPKHGYLAEELERAKIEPLFPGELLLQTAMIVKSDSSIKSWKDLDKKKIGLQSIQGAPHAGTLLAMKGQGVRNPKSEFLAMPSTQMADALRRGDVDAVIANDPFATQIILDGNRVIGYPMAYFVDPGPVVVFISSAEIANNKAKAMRAFQRATLEINKLLNKKENDLSFKRVIADVTKVSLETVEKARLPIMIEKNVTIPEIAYIPSKLKRVGFLKGRFELGKLLFR